MHGWHRSEVEIEIRDSRTTAQVTILDRAEGWGTLLERVLREAPLEAARPGGSALGAATPQAVVVVADPDPAETVAAVQGGLASAPRARLVVVTPAGGAAALPISVRSAASHVLTRDASAEEFVATVRAALGIRSPVTMLARQRSYGASRSSVTLTRAESGVLRQLAAGRSNEEIARVLGISVNTVRSHIQRLTGKLGADSRLRAVALARLSGGLDDIASGEGSA